MKIGWKRLFESCVCSLPLLLIFVVVAVITSYSGDQRLIFQDDR